MTETKFFQLPKETIEPLWPLISARVKSVVERSSGRLTLEAVFRLLNAGTWQCWTFWEDNKCLAVILTKIEQQESGRKTLEAFGAVGDDREKWQRVAGETLKEFARAEGCSLFEMFARPGWERVFPEFKKTHVVLEWNVTSDG